VSDDMARRLPRVRWVAGLCGNVDVFDAAVGRRDSNAVFAHAFEVKFDCLTDASLDLLDCRAADFPSR
jgi:hypothetical protein